MIAVRCDDIFVDTDVDAVKRIWDIVHGFPVKHIIAVTPQGRGNPLHHMKPLKRGNDWMREATGEDYVFNNKELIETILTYQKLGAKIAIHGLTHIDYRKLSYSEQLDHITEAKTIMSLLFDEVEYFVPPFNKYNEDTLKVCKGLSLELVPSYYEADTKIINNNPQSIRFTVSEAVKAGNCAYHPYWLQGEWKADTHIIDGKRFNMSEAKWNLDDSLIRFKRFLKGVVI